MGRKLARPVVEVPAHLYRFDARSERWRAPFGRSYEELAPIMAPILWQAARATYADECGVTDAALPYDTTDAGTVAALAER